jgi:hypothetical protein
LTVLEQRSISREHWLQDQSNLRSFGSQGSAIMQSRLVPSPRLELAAFRRPLLAQIIRRLRDPGQVVVPFLAAFWRPTPVRDSTLHQMFITSCPAAMQTASPDRRRHHAWAARLPSFSFAPCIPRQSLVVRVIPFGALVIVFLSADPFIEPHPELYHVQHEDE